VLASYPARESTPVVVFTASQSDADVDRAFSLGAREFIHKPIELDEYKSVVSLMVRKWTSYDPAGAETLPW